MGVRLLKYFFQTVFFRQLREFYKKTIIHFLRQLFDKTSPYGYFTGLSVSIYNAFTSIISPQQTQPLLFRDFLFS